MSVTWLKGRVRVCVRMSVIDPDQWPLASCECRKTKDSDQAHAHAHDPVRHPATIRIPPVGP